MNNTQIEHVNITVSDLEKTARYLEKIFGWKIRWRGVSGLGGNTIHIGNDQQYLAIYQPKSPSPNGFQALNHIGLLVQDIDAIEKLALEYGFKTHNHGDYSPGKRFYFTDHDGLEIEVVGY